MNNAQKTPFYRSMNRFAEQKVLNAIQLIGKALPCSVVSVSGSIVTVKFEVNAAPFTLPQVTVPMIGPEYARPPTQIGDLGVVRSADASLGGINGLGSGVASLRLPANLSALVFEPISNKNWSTTDDANAYLIYGPNGVILRDTGKNCSVVLDQNNVVITGKTTVKLKVGSNTITVSASGIDIEGTLTINGNAYHAHAHTGVTAGGANTGPVTP